MRLALVKPPNIAHSVRGIGVYGQGLSSGLGSFPNLKAELLGLSFSPFDYKNFDLVHFLYFDPFFLTLPPVRMTKTVVSVFDLTPIVLWPHYPRGLRGEVKWQIQKFLVSKVDHIVTLSENSKSDIQKVLAIPTRKITVTPLAAGEEFHRIRDYKLLQVVANKYQLPEKFILYVGDVNYNKNIPGLLEAFMLVKKKDTDVKLVIVGKAFQNRDLPEVQRINQLIGSLRLNSEVVIVGYVSDQELVAIYNLARVYVQPSIYEGFGLPVVQAMICGLPVVCGRNSSLPEIGGEAAVYAEVGDPEDLAEKIVRVIKMGSSEYRQLSARSHSQANKFSWGKTAARTVAAYEKVLSS